MSSISVSALYQLFNSLHEPSTTVLLHSLHGFRNQKKNLPNYYFVYKTQVGHTCPMLPW